MVEPEPTSADRTLRPLRRGRLYQEIAERLRELIDVQQLSPGDKLMSERELSVRLGVSRTSIRQALTALEVTGLVEVRHGGGVFLLRPPAAVVPLLASEVVNSHEQLPAVIEVREAIETQTSRLAAERRSGADLAALHSALERMGAAIEAGTDPAPADAEFHTAIVRAARNPLLEQLWDQLAEPIDQTRQASLARPGRPPLSLAGHEAVLAAIERGDADEAERSMREHLALVGDLGLPMDR